MTFRATQLAIRTILITADETAGMKVKTEIAYLDPSATPPAIHGTMTHQGPMTQLPKDVQDALRSLHVTLSAHLDRVHFDRPEQAEKRVIRDIATALAASADDPTDRVGKPG